MDDEILDDDSILTSIKKLIGITKEYKQFDTDIMLHINSVFISLMQIGVGKENGFFITTEKDTWKDFIPDNPILVNCIKPYIYLKVKLIFDPPASGNAIESINRIINEFEWRIKVESEQVKKAISKGEK